MKLFTNLFVLIFSCTLAGNIFAADGKRNLAITHDAAAPIKRPRLDNAPQSFQLNYQFTFDESLGFTDRHQQSMKAHKACLMPEYCTSVGNTVNDLLVVEFPLSTIAKPSIKANFPLKVETARVLPSVSNYFPLREKYLGHDREYPLHWTHAETKDVKAFEVELARNDPEFYTIQRMVKSPKEQRIFIHSIKRIENKLRWIAFAQKRVILNRKLKQANGDSYFLFHGTKGAVPEEICLGDDGLDWREGNPRGYYGRGTYFATKFGYAAKYSYRGFSPVNQGVTQKIILALVSTGEVANFEGQKKPTLTRPPLIDPKNFDAGSYTTVSGRHDGTRMYVTYDNALSYPAYIIEFSDRAESIADRVFGGNNHDSGKRDFIWQITSTLMKGWKDKPHLHNFNGWPVNELGLKSLAAYLGELFILSNQDLAVFQMKTKKLVELLGAIQSHHQTLAENAPPVYTFIEVAAKAKLDTEFNTINNLASLFESISLLPTYKPQNISWFDLIDKLTAYKITDEVENNLLDNMEELKGDLDSLRQVKAFNDDPKFKEDKNIFILNFQLREQSKLFVDATDEFINSYKQCPDPKIALHEQLLNNFYSPVIAAVTKSLNPDLAEQESEAELHLGPIDAASSSEDFSHWLLDN